MKLKSSEIKDPLEPFSIKFVNDTGATKEKRIVEKFISNEAQAQERAIAEFIEHGYSTITITFKTFKYYPLNAMVEVDGVTYKVVKITTTIDTKLIFTIEAERYA